VLRINSSKAKGNSYNAIVLYNRRQAKGCNNVREDKASLKLVLNTSNSVCRLLHPLLTIISSCFNSRVPILKAFLTAILRY
jgi:hypothetical protein